MAQSFSNAKVLSAFVSKAINRRGFSAAASSAASTRSGAASMVKNTAEKEVVKSTEKVAWVPDPRTGFYRPENMAKEIDAAELRAVLLKKH
ncbi:protein SENESCENCE-ASSOCIATED GENE 21, mitochondrial-like [Mercurialis annua]|uniref:protein SENESCENCE-ASSOCIATED GENE 21, mitochondrial-like n=1 Tax=Mercurialis annua TaxID=3986 RepID=UPI00215E8246|nr:protein SENESCENCE-ASSOCIATED GENE 21, mitochondrial-like [Mercurialis annua]